MSEARFPCLISDTRACNPTPPKNLVFIIGSGNPEFTEDLKVVKEVLKGFGFEGYFALLSEEEKGLDAFCDKICSKILNSVFCVAILNDPIVLEYIDKVSKQEKVLRAPRANVYYEFGIAIALRKRVIPLMREDIELPFDVQHLDAIPYKSLSELKEKLITSVRATLLKPSKERILKTPRIGLLLVDEEGVASEIIKARPIITKIRYLEKEEPISRGPTLADFAKAAREIAWMKTLKRPPPKDLVPIGIEIWNEGEIPAQNIAISLEFPEDCELFEESDVTGGGIPTSLNRSMGGLYVDNEGKRTVGAWLNRLGNDRMTREFDKIYVRFKTEEEKEYLVNATVIQDNYPPTYFEFKIVVKPEIVEETKYRMPE